MLQAVCLVILTFMVPIFGGSETLIRRESDGVNQQIGWKESILLRRNAIQKACGVVSRIADKDVTWRQKAFMSRDQEALFNYLDCYHQHENPVTYSLSELVEKILGHLSLHPEQRIMVVWDVDDTLTHTSNDAAERGDWAASESLHPKSDILIRVLYDLGVDMILVTAGCFTDYKLYGANIGTDMFSKVIESVGYEGAAASKGEAVRDYLDSLSDDQRPDHLFFVDDQAWGHCQNGFVEQVSSVGKLGITVLQHNEAHFFRDRNEAVQYAEACDVDRFDVEEGKLTSEPAG